MQENECRGGSRDFEKRGRFISADEENFKFQRF